MCRVISIELNNNPKWMSFVKDTLEPLIELERGKLCEDKNVDNSGSTNFDGNIFDDDFLKNPFDNNEVEDKDDNLFDFNNKAESKEDDEDDNHKFFKKIQQCFSSNPNRNRKNSEDLVDVNEREEKQKSYSE